jgi:hypothetical protein
VWCSSGRGIVAFSAAKERHEGQLQRRTAGERRGASAESSLLGVARFWGDQKESRGPWASGRRLYIFCRRGVSGKVLWVVYSGWEQCGKEDNAERASIHATNKMEPALASVCQTVCGGCRTVPMLRSRRRRAGGVLFATSVELTAVAARAPYFHHYSKSRCRSSNSLPAASRNTPTSLEQSSANLSNADGLGVARQTQLMTRSL